MRPVVILNVVFYTLGIVGTSGFAYAQAPANGTPTVVVAQTGAPPNLRALLNDASLAGLSGFTHISGFVQQTPTDGAPATGRTDVYLAYDREAIHAVFVATDPDPNRIRARMAPRENVGGDDVVTLMLDTDLDRRRAYAFRANPLGVQWDALWTEGQGFDTSFDAVWSSEGALTASGYIVVFSIPFGSLRFQSTGEQTWGLVMSRSVPREQGEVSYWPRVSSRIQGTLTQAGSISGLVDVTSGRNVQAIPYTSMRSFRALDRAASGGPRFVSEAADVAVGADFKAVLNDRYVVDLTANPDFSHVESDQPQVTVNQRFELFFPERRAFFTENADYFRTPLSLLFTRRIADPRIGARFTGKAGAWNLGGLVTDDRSPGKLAPPESELSGRSARFAIARMSRDVGAFSRVGAIYTGRELEGDHSRVLGTDGRVRLSDQWSVSGQVARSWNRVSSDRDEVGNAAFASVSRTGRLFSYSGSYTDIDESFETGVGFVPRKDLRRLSHFASYFARPEGTLISWGPELFVRYIWDQQGELLEELREASLEWNFVGGTSFEVNYREARERFRPQDHPGLTATRTFDTSQWDIEFGTSHLDWLQVSGNVRFGKQVNLSPPAGEEPSSADWSQLVVNANFRPSVRFRIDNTVLLTGLDSPRSDGRIFNDRIFRTRWNWQFTRALAVRAILQYEERNVAESLTSLSDRMNLNADLLLTYRVSPWTAIYLGMNANGQNLDLIEVPNEDRRLIRVDELHRDGHQFFVKASYLLRK